MEPPKMASACALMFSKSIPEKQKFDHVPVRYLVDLVVLNSSLASLFLKSSLTVLIFQSRHKKKQRLNITQPLSASFFKRGNI
mgnify:FL=1